MSAFQNIPIQNLCFPEQGICDVPGLYYHESAAELLLDGWYNLVYLRKWKRYTFGEKLLLKLALGSLKHYTALRVYCDRKQILERAFSSLEEPENGRELTLELPYQALKGSVLYIGFVKKTGETAHHISGRFCLSVPEGRTRNVGIGINICTFRRESYISHNLDY